MVASPKKSIGKKLMAWVLSLAIAMTFVPILGGAVYADGDEGETNPVVFTIYTTYDGDPATDVTGMKKVKEFTMNDMATLAGNTDRDFLCIKSSSQGVSGALKGDYVLFKDMVSSANDNGANITDEDITSIKACSLIKEDDKPTAYEIYSKLDFVDYYGKEAYFGKDSTGVFDEFNSVTDVNFALANEGDVTYNDAAISLKTVSVSFTSAEQKASELEIPPVGTEEFGTTICGSIPDGNGGYTIGGNRFAKDTAALIFYMVDSNKIATAEKAINAIGTVDYTKAAKIKGARTAYDALTDAEKAKISAATLKKLTDAEKIIKVIPSKQTTVKLKNVKTRTMKASWSKVTNAGGYEVWYALDKKFKKSCKKSKQKSLSKTVKKLKKGKTYYVKVRAYKTVDKKNYYGPWSSVKSVKIKK